jgi:hypothetical protein
MCGYLQVNHAIVHGCRITICPDVKQATQPSQEAHNQCYHQYAIAFEPLHINASCRVHLGEPLRERGVRVLGIVKYRSPHFMPDPAAKMRHFPFEEIKLLTCQCPDKNIVPHKSLCNYMLLLLARLDVLPAHSTNTAQVKEIK